MTDGDASRFARTLLSMQHTVFTAAEGDMVFVEHGDESAVVSAEALNEAATLIAAQILADDFDGYVQLIMGSEQGLRLDTAIGAAVNIVAQYMLRTESHTVHGVTLRSLGRFMQFVQTTPGVLRGLVADV